MNFIFVLLIAVGLTACSSFSRSEQSGYSENSESTHYDTLTTEKQAYDESVTRQELGYLGNYPLTGDEEDRLHNRLVLKKLEARMQSDRERRQYFSLKSLMNSDNERVQFLRLPTIDARERYASDHGIRNSDQNFSPQTATLIEKNDIALGMSHRAVQESWGDPDLIEVSGNPTYGNQRWKYTRYVSGTDGYNKQLRFIYFEAGRVVGWETL